MNTRLLAGASSRLLASSRPQTSNSGRGRTGRWLLAAAALLGGSGLAQAQHTLPSPGPLANITRFGLSTGNGFIRTAAIYRAADIRAAGGSITNLNVYLYRRNTPGDAPIKIYLKPTSATQFTANTTVAAEEAGATLVYDATVPAATFNAVSATGGYVSFPLSTPYAYATCDNLEVIIETNAGGTGNESVNGVGGATLDGKVTGYAADGGGGRVTTIVWFADNAAPTGAQQINFVGIRPLIQATGLTATAAPDAGVMQILTQNKVLVTSSGGATQVVKAFVRNYGASLAGTPVTLTVTGPGGFTFSDTQTVTLTASGVTTVTFAAYTPPATAGTGTVAVGVAAAGDTYACNNTMTEAQEFSATDISYVTPGIFSPGGRGFGAAAFPRALAFEARFTTAATRNITAVRVRFSNDAASVGRTVYGVVVNPTTGATIARSADYVIQASDLDGLTTHEFTLTSPVTLPAGSYLAGLAQTYASAAVTNYFPMGTQPEYQGRGGSFYTSDLTTPSVPGDIGTAAAVNYKYPIELVTDNAPACAAVTSVTAGSITTTSASISFTAPGGATDYTVLYVPTAGGTPVTLAPNPTGSPVALSGLTPGTAYTVSVTSNCTGGLTSPTATGTFTTLPTDDAAVLAIYTLGQLPIPYATPHAVSVAVRNNGTGATPIPATLTVTGPGGFSFTDTQTSASTAAGATSTVTFAPYTPTAVGTYTVTVTTGLAGDQIAGNDTQSTTQTVSTSTYGYAPLAAVANGSVGFGTGSGLLVAKFTSSSSRLVTIVRANLSAGAVGNTVYGVILSSTGVLLGRSNNLVVTAAGLTTFTLQTPVTVPAGAFFAGLAQTANATTAYFPLGTQTELPTRAGAFYTAPLAGGTPGDVASSSLGRFIIEAVTDDVPTCGQVSNLVYTTRTDTSVGIGFNAPTGSSVTNYTVTLTPTAGGAPLVQTVTASPATFTGLTPGAGYTVSIVTNCAMGGGSSAATTATLSTLPNLIVSSAQNVGGTYYNVTVTSTGAATIAADLNVSGIMTVQSGGSVRTDAITFYIRGTGRFILEAGATLIETNTVGITNTGSGGFLLTGTVPVTFSPDANYIFAGTGAQATGALMPSGARNLTVNNAGGLTLTNGLRVAQLLRLQSGNLNLNGRSLLLPSSAAGTALVDNTGGVVNGNTASMERAITNTTVTGRAYRHFSSPVTSVIVDSLGTGGTQPVVNGSYNSSATPGIITPFPTVFGYDESRLATVTSTYGAFDKGWFSPTSLGDAVQPTRGYTVMMPATANAVRFTGTFNNGVQNTGPLSRGAGAQAGWHLRGNPYPAPLDWSTVTAAQRPGMDAAMYVYQSTSQYTGTYRSYANGIGASPLINAGAGYFVRVTTPGTPGSVNLTNANRVTTFGPEPAFGRGTTDTRPQLQLNVLSGVLHDAMHVYFEAGATALTDAGFDAVKLANPNGLNLAALAGNTELSINGLAPLAGTDVVVPLNLRVPQAGSFAFEVADFANFGTATVLLRDAATGTEQVLTAGARYSFTLPTATAGTGRFALVFRSAKVTAAQASLAAGLVSVYPNPAHAKFTVLLPPVAGQKAVQATLLNALGQTVQVRTIALTAAGATSEFDVQGLAAGVYALRLQAGAQSTTQRVVVE